MANKSVPCSGKACRMQWLGSAAAVALDGMGWHKPREKTK